MRYYAASQVKSSGLWHYTCRRKDDVYPVGYCSIYETCPDCKGMGYGGTCQNENCKYGVVPKVNPCPGHATPEEACEHYREYVLDKARYTHSEDTQQKCEICSEWTTGHALIDGYHMHILCDKHANKESLEKVYPLIHESYES